MKKFSLWIMVIGMMCLAMPMQAQDTNLIMRDVVLRYAGGDKFGTLALVVCNTSNRPVRLSNSTMSIEANGITVDVSAGEVLNQQECMHYFNADSDFTTFGITDTGIITVTATLDDESHSFDVDIRQLTTIGAQTSLENYQSCLGNSDHIGCFLDVYDTPLDNPAEVKIQYGQFFVITPLEHERLGALYALDLAQCTKNVSAYLGVDLPVQALSRRLLIDETRSGSSAGGNFIMTFAPSTTFSLMRSNLGEWWSALNNDGCLDPHETTHIFVYNTPIPGWFNEGLATFMEDTSRTNARQPMGTDCLDGAFVSMYYGSREEIPFLSLQNADYDASLPGIYYYWTSACFWEHIRITYGDEAIAQIVGLLTTFRDPIYNGCPFNRPLPETRFLRDVVVPVVGEDILIWTEANLNVGADYSGCEMD